MGSAEPALRIHLPWAAARAAEIMNAYDRLIVDPPSPPASKPPASSRPAHPASSQAELRAALAGVGGLLIDLDGVLILKGEVLPGAAAGLAELDRRSVPYRIVTNTSRVSRVTLAAECAVLGLPIRPDRIVSALSACADLTRRRFDGLPLYVIASRDARREFDGQRLLRSEEADEPGRVATAVVVGDASDEFAFDNLNRAFRLLRRGARLIAMHRNPWWLTPAGPTLDAGAFVRALEYASGQRAFVVGKPAAALFREASAAILSELGGYPRGSSRIRPSELGSLAMVGDDLWNDVLAAQRSGLRGVFVLSGKHGPADLADRARRSPRNRPPDAVAETVRQVIAGID